MSEYPGETITFCVPARANNIRADKVLAEHFPDLSRSRIQSFFDAGRVWRDNEALVKKQKVATGDILHFSIPPSQPIAVLPVAIPLKVIHEDEHLIAIDKAAGMVVHPGHSTGQDTLVHALLYHCQGKLSRIGGTERPGIVHRLDRGTSGVILAAKSDQAFLALSAAFAQRRVNKKYLALVHGVPRAVSGSIQEPIARHPHHPTKVAVVPGGRFAHSDWRVVETLGRNFSLLRVRIHTGRTHQIRVHLAHIGHPIVGDTTYGNRKTPLPEAFSIRPLLHARRLVVDHPAKREPFTCTAPLPEDFETVMEYLRKQGCE